jgi:hypothetical protein
MAGAAPGTGQLNAVPMLAAVVGTAFKTNHFIQVCIGRFYSTISNLNKR